MPVQPHLIAAVDMGSSSFRMIVARVEYPLGQPQIHIIDSLREPLRLGAGLNEDKTLSKEAQQRALEALGRFAERLRSFHPDQVRAVATNAVRVARNGAEFIEKAQDVLGFEIDVISGIEEARLVYTGVAHQLPLGQGRRLVVDIGGGSTEFVLGQDYEPLAMESLYIGCVTMAQKYFGDGSITSKAMKSAIMEARREIVVLRRQLTEIGWTHVVGSSGTSRTLSEICVANGYCEHGLTADAVERLKSELLAAGHIDRVKLEAVRSDRKANLAGGLAVMAAVFEELELEELEVSEGALRQGILYDLIGRTENQDMREITVAQFVSRYKIDVVHAHKVKALTEILFESACASAKLPNKNILLQVPLLGWTALLHEVGLSISHNGHHKHSAYILGKSDMPGFSKKEQAQMADWVLAHNGKLTKVAYLASEPQYWLAPMCLRLATLFLRRREIEALPQIELKLLPNGLSLSLPDQWLEDHPLTQYSLEIEVDQWEKVGLKLDLKNQDFQKITRSKSSG